MAVPGASVPLPLAAAWVPLRRFAVMGAGAVLLGAARIPGRPHTVCPLRALTGIPCPLCGGTTAAVRVGQGHLLAGLAASPLTFLGAIVLILAATPVGRHAVRSWRERPATVKVLLGTALLTAAELWQLARFGLI